MSPSTIFLILANLLPLAGVFWWGWDAFLLLILYWGETVVIAFWTIVRLLVGPTQVSGNTVGAGQPAGLAARVSLAVFFTVHAGIFIIVHFVFLWSLFSGTWAAEVHGVGSFIRVILIGTDLWLPLAVLFIVRGLIVMGPAIRRRLGWVDPGAVAENVANPIFALYSRIFVMQVTIIFGGWFAIVAGDSVGPLALLVLAKTVAEVFFDAKVRPAATPGAAGDRPASG